MTVDREVFLAEYVGTEIPAIEDMTTAYRGPELPEVDVLCQGGPHHGYVIKDTRRHGIHRFVELGREQEVYVIRESQKQTPQHGHGLTAEEIRQLVGDAPIILEIGCNDGMDTERFLEAMPGAFVYCFEPDPRPAARWIRRLGNHPRAHLTTLAIGAHSGTRILHLSGGDIDSPCNPDRDWDASSSLREPTGHLDRDKQVTFGRHITVGCVGLDDWVPTVGPLLGGPPRPIFIWADVQGAEGELIAGGSRVLSHTAYFYTEFYDIPQYEGQPNLAEICRMLSDSFDLVGLYGSDNALFKHR